MVNLTIIPPIPYVPRHAILYSSLFSVVDKPRDRSTTSTSTSTSTSSRISCHLLFLDIKQLGLLLAMSQSTNKAPLSSILSLLHHFLDPVLRTSSASSAEESSLDLLDLDDILNVLDAFAHVELLDNKINRIASQALRQLENQIGKGKGKARDDGSLEDDMARLVKLVERRRGRNGKIGRRGLYFAFSMMLRQNVIPPITFFVCKHVFFTEYRLSLRLPVHQLSLLDNHLSIFPNHSSNPSSSSPLPIYSPLRCPLSRMASLPLDIIRRRKRARREM